jgi:hypothetical protein
LRIQAPRPFQLHWTTDEWLQVNDTAATATALGVYFVEIPIENAQRAAVRFTFLSSALRVYPQSP